MKRYVLNLGGYESTPMSEREIRQLFQTGAVEAVTPCCAARADTWSTVEAIFPSLKNEVRYGQVKFAPGAGPMRRTVARLLVAPSANELMNLIGSRP